MKEKITLFLESFLIDLTNPQHLDISYNYLEDECLYPIVKYIFANTEAKHLQFVNLEWNNFTNYCKRTIVVAYSKCYNKKL
jgi:hypothetical protein